MPTQANRLIGNYAVLHIGAGAGASTGFLVAQLVDWSVDLESDFADITAHGDYWDVSTYLRHRWTGRCGGFLTEASRVTFLSAWNSGGQTGSGNGDIGPYKNPAPYTFIGYNDHLSLSAAKILFRGTCLASVASIQLPDGASRQEITFRGRGSPAYIGAATP